MKKVGDEFLRQNCCLESLSLPSLEEAGDDFLENVKGLKLLFVPSLEETKKEELFKRLCIEEDQVEKSELNLSTSEGMHEVAIAKIEPSSETLGNTINEVIKSSGEIMIPSTDTIELEGVIR